MPGSPPSRRQILAPLSLGAGMVDALGMGDVRAHASGPGPRRAAGHSPAHSGLSLSRRMPRRV